MQSSASRAPSVAQAGSVLAPLRELDEVAYLRFASVYRGFESADDFETGIAMLRAVVGKQPGPGPPEEEGKRFRAVQQMQNTSVEVLANVPHVVPVLRLPQPQKGL